MGKLRVALAQINVVWGNKVTNQRRCAQYVRRAAVAKADLIIFPEMTLTGFTMNHCAVAEEYIQSQTVMFFKNLARAYHIGVVFGVVIKGAKKSFNTAVVLDNYGRLLSRYNKIHPFTFAGEHHKYEGGKNISMFKIKKLSMSVVVCYDLRFPGLFEVLSHRANEISIIIANWPIGRIHHWDTLLAARALDTQGYVIGVNRVGNGGGLNYNGHSSVYSPWAERIGWAGEKEKLLVVTLDKDVVVKYRKNFTSLKDKKTKLYNLL